MDSSASTSGRIASIVIPAYNSARTLVRTLDALLAQTGDCIAEILVVDSSDDGAMDEVIATYASRGVTFLRAGTRVMPAVQRNLGAKHAKGRLLVFLDADVIPEPDYVETIVAHYLRGYLAGGGSIEVPDFQADKWIPLAAYYLQVNEFLPSGEDRVKPFVTGCNNFCDREIFEKVGGFPEVRASEDTLFGLAVSAVTPLWFLPGARVAHIFREDLKGFLANQELLGKYVAAYRKQQSKNIAFRRPFPVLFFPLFFGIKVARILPRIVASGFPHVAKATQASPVVLLGLLYWNLGFTKEAMRG